MKISLVYKKGALEEAGKVRAKAEAGGMDVLSISPLDEFSPGPEDLIVVVGGDGSFLRIADMTEKPIALLRYDSFGFFASWDSGRAEDLFEDLKLGRAERVELGKIEAEFQGKRELAVNEFFMKGCEHSAAFDITVRNCDDIRISFRGDGVMIVTPAGSAAHAFSFGGPLLCPDVDAFVIMPVAPIRNNLHPIVISGDSEIVVESYGDVQLVADGQRSFRVDMVRIKRSEKRVTLIKKESYGDKIKRLMA